MTVFRRLRDLNYLSSFSHAGRYYTLPHIPHFNAHGLWFYETVCFSRYGPLKATLVQLVERSTAGKTHEELEKQVRLRVHNALLDLVRSRQLTRERVKSYFVYLSAQPHRAQQQLSCRREGISGSPDDVLTDEIIAQVLAEIVRSNQVQIDHGMIIKGLAIRGVVVSRSQLTQLLTQLGLKKTLGFAP